MEGVILPDGEYDDLVLQLRVVSRAACAGPCGRTTVKSRAVRRVWVVRAPDSASVCVYLFNKQSRGGEHSRTVYSYVAIVVGTLVL